MTENLRLPTDNVSVDFEALLKEVFAGDKNKNCVVMITTDTGGHFAQIIAACKAGAKFIICDKPLVMNLSECLQVRNALIEFGVTLFLTYNHVFNAPVHQIRRLAKEVGVKSVSSWFLQSWLNTNHKGLRQFDWRTADKLCGPLDIWSHAQNLASFVVGEPIASVARVRLGYGGGHEQGEIYTKGDCVAVFQNGVQGLIDFDQALESHLDDIGVSVTLADGRTLMWRLELGVDNLWVSNQVSPSASSLSCWTRHMRGSSFFAEDINNTFNAAPPGHHDGWGTMWQYLFSAAAGTIYRKLGTNLGPGPSAPILSLEVPGIAAAEQTARFIAAAVNSFEKRQGGEVFLADVKP